MNANNVETTKVGMVRNVCVRQASTKSKVFARPVILTLITMGGIVFVIMGGMGMLTCARDVMKPAVNVKDHMPINAPDAQM
jgi:hypothetical protein